MSRGITNLGRFYTLGDLHPWAPVRDDRRELTASVGNRPLIQIKLMQQPVLRLQSRGSHDVVPNGAMLLRLRLPHSTIRLGDRLAATSGVGQGLPCTRQQGAAGSPRKQPPRASVTFPDGGVTPFKGGKLKPSGRVPCALRWPDHIRPGTVRTKCSRPSTGCRCSLTSLARAMA
jgi:hypothetical protein